jgi:hypothetical protein
LNTNSVQQASARSLRKMHIKLPDSLMAIGVPDASR